MGGLDVGQLRALVEVAEQRHFGRAAARLNLVQQALSARMQRLPWNPSAWRSWAPIPSRNRVTPIGAQWSMPAGIRVVPVAPTPYLPWSIIWRTTDTHPALAATFASLTRPVMFNPSTDWLPAPDVSDLPA